MSAAADSKKPQDEVDVQGFKAEMILLHDGRNHYVALVPYKSEALFYGDGKTFYQQRVFSSSSDKGESKESRSFWAPTSPPRAAGDISTADGKWTIQCADRKTPMAVVNEAETRKLLAKAVFKKPFWKRAGAALGRDDDGVYYFVDKIRDDRSRSEQWEDPHPPTGFRLFVGRKGKLKAQTIIDTAIDSKGMVLTMKKSSLSVDESNKRMVLSKGSKREELIYLGVEDNMLLVYRDLGIYGKLGVPCDTM
jgi:hypothetical protein